MRDDHLYSSAPRTRRRWLLAVALLGLVILSLVASAATGLLQDWRVLQQYPFSYGGLIEKYAGLSGIDPLLVAAVIRAESNFWTWAVSSKDARGLMQITPSTGAWVAEQVGAGGFEVRLLHDAEYNIALGCWYLAHLLRTYRGNLPMTLAAWNGGPTNVNSWLAAGQWSGGFHDLDRVPFAETRTFVQRVLDNLTWYQALYGEVAM